MPVLRPRNRLVIFRVSDEEYEALRTAYAGHGARSMSDFARSAALRSAAGQESLATLSHKVAELEAQLAGLMKIVGPK